MPLHGEYEPPANDWLRAEIDKVMTSGTTDSISMEGMAVVLLTTVGKRSGKLRKIPLMRVEHDGEYVVVASKGGAPAHPEWFHNVEAHPEVELQDGTVTKDYQARELSGDERAVWWDRAVAAFPPYAEYQTKTERTIPLLLLTEN